MPQPVWMLIPRVGIECSDFRIHLGMDRTAIGNHLAGLFPAPVDNGYDDEDDYITEDEQLFIRLRFAGSNLNDIEFLQGDLRLDGIRMHAGATLSHLKEHFAKQGVCIRPSEWLGDGTDFVDLGINIAAHEDVGSDGDGVEWVILSKNFTSQPGI